MPITSTVETRRIAPFIRAPVAGSHCFSCHSRRSRRTGTPFCGDCLERAKPYDADDPYDELGGGD